MTRRLCSFSSPVMGDGRNEEQGIVINKRTTLPVYTVLQG